MVCKKAKAAARRLLASLAAKVDRLFGHNSRVAMRLEGFNPSYWRVISSLSAVVLNIVLIAIIAGSLGPRTSHDSDELHLVLAPSTRVEAAAIPKLPDIELPALQMPDIVIAREALDTAPSTLAASLVLAPRPDPEHLNPTYPIRQGERGPSPGSVILKILVLADGSVADATVEKTSGASDADESAITFVKTQWKFLPALLKGNPIRYRTTVAVRLS